MDLDGIVESLATSLMNKAQGHSLLGTVKPRRSQGKRFLGLAHGSIEFKKWQGI